MGDLDTVDAGQDVDTVGAEYGYSGHVGIVEPPKIQQLAEVLLEGERNDHFGDTEIDKVDDQNWDRGEGWNEELVAPSYIKQIVTYTKDNGRL